MSSSALRNVKAHAALPPLGLSSEEAEAVQKWIRGNCNRLDPTCPRILSPERFGNDDRRTHQANMQTMRVTMRAIRTTRCGSGCQSVC